MHLSFETENLSELDRKVLALLGGVATPSNDAEAKPAAPKEEAKPAPKAEAKPAPKKAAAKKEEPTPEPIAEEPLPEVVEEESDEENEIPSDELLKLATKKATEMVSSGQAAKVREALDAAGVNRVREINTDNVREFFKALS